jgi:hypothetical protein
MFDLESTIDEQIWSVANSIRNQDCLPIISDNLIMDALFGEPGVARAWAEKVQYPLKGRASITAIAQYLAVAKDDEARLDYHELYLRYLAEELLTRERARPDANLQLLDMAEQQRRRFGSDFTAFAQDQLHMPALYKQALDAGSPCSLLLLAEMPFRAYVTTSPHFFIERALRVFAKNPQPRAFCWKVLNIPEKYMMQPDETGTVEAPLVYHLFGVEDIPSSLVLTEDDHFEFLVSIQDKFKDTRETSNYFRSMFRARLLLLGYAIDGWDFRVLLKGMIKTLTARDGRVFDTAIQLDPTDQSMISDLDRYRYYIRRLFEHDHFRVILQKPDAFIARLQQEVGAAESGA